MDEIKITKHAYIQAKKRLGLKKKSVLRMAKIALENGSISRNQTNKLRGKGDLVSADSSRQEYMHGQFKFIFCGHTLITIMPIKTIFRKDMYYGR